MCSWWAERNNIREEGIRRPIPITVRSVLCYAAEVINLMKKGGERELRTLKIWRKPAEGIVKINCDASFWTVNSAGGWGYIIRDWAGNVISAGRDHLPHLLDAFQAEVVASMQGIQAAIDLGISRVVIKTDSLLVQQAVTSNQWNLSPNWKFDKGDSRLSPAQLFFLPNVCCF